MIWQDITFANGMYPSNTAYLQNVKQEVIYQIERLKKYPCILLWFGNNEIDKAWQNQFNVHGVDSAIGILYEYPIFYLG